MNNTMKYVVLQTKAGWIVQNKITNVVVYNYPTKEQAQTVADNLNK